MNKTVTIESRNFKYANTFGGNIYIDDFNTNYNTSHNIANRIISDWKFDKECNKNIELRERRF